jgi:hypothetical protein
VADCPYDIDDLRAEVAAAIVTAMAGVHGCVAAPGDEAPGDRDRYNQTRPVLGDDGVPAA